MRYEFVSLTAHCIYQPVSIKAESPGPFQVFLKFDLQFSNYQFHPSNQDEQKYDDGKRRKEVHFKAVR